MYESFFRLSRRPFSAAPDADQFVATPAAAEALQRIERCVRQGRGVAVLTGAAGVGKSTLLHRLAADLERDFGVIVVPNACFTSPRGFLQLLLAGLGETYERLGETELRLRLTDAAWRARQTTEGFCVLLDEAHRLGGRLLQEIRSMANQVESGEPLFRTVIAGQLELEDQLAESGQHGLNERIGELVALPRLTAEESRQYLAVRLERAGGAWDELFEPAATTTVVQACGGIPRCLNQLADHALLLASVAQRSTVSECLVREALDDLKRLPLQWCDPRPTSRANDPVADIPPAGEDHSWDSGPDDEVVEIGSLEPVEDGTAMAADPNPTRPEQRGAERQCSRRRHGIGEHGEFRELLDDTSEFDHSPLPPPSPGAAPPLEEVTDRFARLDAAVAQQRWLDEIEREPAPRDGAAPSVLRRTAPRQTDAGAGATRPRESFNADPDPNESLESDESGELSPELAPTADSETDRCLWKAPHSPETLFRDFRRRQGLS